MNHHDASPDSDTGAAKPTESGLHHAAAAATHVPSPAMTAYWDLALVCRMASEAFTCWLDLKPGGLRGLKLSDLLGDELMAANQPFVHKVLAGVTQEFSQMIPGADGYLRATLVKYVPHFVRGQVAGFVCYVTDVSRLLRAEAEMAKQVSDIQASHHRLQRKEYILRQAQRLAGIGSWDWDVDENVICWSEELYRIFKWNVNTPPPTFSEQRHLFTPESWRAMSSEVERILLCGGNFSLDLEYRADDGKTAWVEARGTMEHDESGAMHLFGTVLELAEDRQQRRNVLAEKRLSRQQQEIDGLRRKVLHLQEVLARASTMVMVGRLSVGVIHSFKNAMFAAINALRQFARFHVDPLMREWLEIAQMAIASASALARNVLRVSQNKTSTPLANIELNAMLEDFAPVFRAAVDAGVTVELQRSRPVWLKTDVRQFEMAILNLVVNAADALADGGKIVLSVQDDSHNVRRHKPHMVGISVRDDGCGMTPYVLKRAREPYFTSKDQGTGLGLATVNAFVKTLGGYLNLESSPGKGTVATLVLPAQMAR